MERKVTLKPLAIPPSSILTILQADSRGIALIKDREKRREERGIPRAAVPRRRLTSGAPSNGKGEGEPVISSSCGYSAA